MNNPLAEDLDAVLTQAAPAWAALRGARLFITGGTGFFGCWLLESLAWANDRMGLGAHATVLTRGPDAFRARAPHLAQHASIALLQGDVRSFQPSEGPFTHVIHGAAEASARLNADQPLVMFDTIVVGTRRVLDFAVHAGVQRVLLISSGAVYGRQPPELEHVSEEYGGGPDPSHPGAAYAEGKRAAELLGAIWARHHGLHVSIARCFAFVGPYLPLDRHFAVGNFVRDALSGGPVRVLGDGTPFRSYLYASDLAAWLWTILAAGVSCRPYNVGSEQAVSIAQIAETVASVARCRTGVTIALPAQSGKPAERYVPSTARAREELGVRETVPLPEAVARTLRWHRGRAAQPGPMAAGRAP